MQYRKEIWMQFQLMHMLLAVVLLPCAAAQEPQETAFTLSAPEEYRFDTGQLSGTLRHDGKSLGLSPFTHISSGTRLDGNQYGVFSHYRVFTTNKRYGHGAWEWPSTSKILPDGGVAIHWPAAPDRPFEMRAVYRWTAPDTLDLETTVTAQKDLPGFESFLASYLHGDFAASSVYVKNLPGTEGKPGFATTERAYGHWQMFPRSKDLVPLIQDGRWTQPPSPVDWAIRPDLAAPLGIRRNTKDGLCAILMAPPEDCFALATPYEGEGHFSLYLALFGRLVKAGETVTAHARLVIAAALTDAEIVTSYEAYIAEFKRP
jgi:hypothetical protein